MGKKVYVGNMSYEVSQADLEQMFGDHGTVTLLIGTDLGWRKRSRLCTSRWASRRS